MKKSYILIALAMVAAFTMVSCKNNSKNQEPTQGEVQGMKQALADSVLAQIDALMDEYNNASINTFYFKDMILTDKEKLVKPDYLLDPAVADTLLTNTQKVSALAFYIADLQVRKIYDMPMEEAKAVIAKLAAELNHAVDTNTLFDLNVPSSEKIKANYEKCRENGDLTPFWQFQNAMLVEVSYIITQNPELFFSKITDEQWENFKKKIHIKSYALGTLAQYDEEMAQILDFVIKYVPFSSEGESKAINSSRESAKKYRIENKDKFVARRNALLQ